MDPGLVLWVLLALLGIVWLYVWGVWFIFYAIHWLADLKRFLPPTLRKCPGEYLGNGVHEVCVEGQLRDGPWGNGVDCRRCSGTGYLPKGDKGP